MVGDLVAAAWSSTDAATVKRFKAVFFDFDGVLITSEPIWWSVIEEVFHQRHVVARDAVVKRVDGLRLDKVISLYVTDKQRATSIEKQIRRLANRQIIREPLTDGVVEAVHELFAAGITLGVVSSSTSDLLEAVLRKHRIRGHFSVLIGGEQVEEAKPAPDCYLLAARQAMVDERECCVVEDSEAGMQAAEDAGMYVIPFATSEEGRASPTRQSATSLSAVTDIILDRT
jgi:mannitol-1-/sugar-/sorbitol-6-/2-deoxyglucose-6-phosphatase